MGSKPASEVGQSAGSFGTASSNIGQTAGSYGHSVASLGAPPPPSGPPRFTDPIVEWVSLPSTRLGNTWSITLAALHRGFPELKERVAYVKFEDLQDRLAALEGSAEYPDVLIGNTLQARSQAFLKPLTLAHLGAPHLDPPAFNGRSLPQPAESLILQHARHPAEARAFVVWLSDELCGECTPRPAPDTARIPAALAASSTDTLLHGTRPATDPAFADLSPAAAVLMTLWPPSPASLNPLTLKTDVIQAAANERFAVVALRAIADSPEAFGVVHPLVLLRASVKGTWRVLQISTDLPGASLLSAFNALQPYARHTPPDRLKPLAAMAPVAPIDGDTRSQTADLWWHNPGGASLVIVEWQRALAGWSDSHLLLVPQEGPYPRERVTAPFSGTGQYRWRVWAVGTGGTLALSPWSRLTLLP